MQNRAKRRENFPGLVGWKTSKSGNPYIKKDGHHIVITQGRGNYSAIVDGTSIGKWYPSIDKAKLAAFDCLYPATMTAAE
jgi:hypothetical protein